jgi:hypothetical protein
LQLAGSCRDWRRRVREHTDIIHAQSLGAACQACYRVDGQDYEADGVEPGDLGLQNSAASREQGRAYKPGTQVMIAYDPRNPARAYLLPGPSSPSLMLALVGGVLVLAGTWAAWR